VGEPAPLGGFTASLGQLRSQRGVLGPQAFDFSRQRRRSPADLPGVVAGPAPDLPGTQR